MRRYPGIFDPLRQYFESRFDTPLLYLVGRLPVTVSRCEPVEVHVIHFFQTVFGSVIHLADVPIYEPLNIDFPFPNSEQRDVLRNRYGNIQFAERFT